LHRTNFFTCLLLATSLLANSVFTVAQQPGGATLKTPAAPASSPKGKLTDAQRAAERITAAKLRADLFYVASDEMAGRDTPSRGLDMTAEFIVKRLRELKFKPAGDDGTFFQRIPLTGYRIDAAKTTARLNDTAFRFGDDFVTTLAGGAARGQLVYVGHGWVVKSKNINAYAGVDVRDKIMVVTSIRPEGVARTDTPPRRREQSGMTRLLTRVATAHAASCCCLAYKTVSIILVRVAKQSSAGFTGSARTRANRCQAYRRSCLQMKCLRVSSTARA
jgi:hypothetical protein